MAGTFTNARALNKTYKSKAQYAGVTLGSTTAPGGQLTTSFRTGRRKADADLVGEWLKVQQNGYQPYFPNSTDTGHEFYTLRKESMLTLSDFHADAVNPFTLIPIIYDGWVEPLVTGQSTNVYPTVVPMTNSELLAFGSKAIANTIPTNPSSSVVRTVGEILLEGRLPKILGAIPTLLERATILRSAGDKYLNVQFGWLPFISDLSQICRAVLDVNNIIKQYERDSGRWVRRKYQFPEVVSSSETLIGSGRAYMEGLSRSNIQQFFLSPNFDAADVFRQDTLSQRTWFSGAYTYYLNGGSSAIDKLVQDEDKINKVLGTRLTPDIIWEITPWTWLFDWVINLGDSITNFSRFQSDSLVLRYGYLMRETIATRIYTMGPCYLKRGGTITPKRTFKVTQKERLRATPYGFGLNPDAFSASQVATLIALGFTRSPRGWN
jgi:hypothetical protein